MVLFIVKKEVFQSEQKDVNPEDIGLTQRTILGVDCYTARWDEEMGIDDLNRQTNRHHLAMTISELEGRLDVVRSRSDTGVYVTNNLDVWREVEIKADIERLKLDPDLEYSQKCERAVMWFTLLAERHIL